MSSTVPGQLLLFKISGMRINSENSEMDRFLIAKDTSSKSTMCVQICQFIPWKPQPSQWPDQFKGERKGHKSAKIILLFKLQHQFHGKFFGFKLKTPIPKFSAADFMDLLYNGSYKYDTLPPLPYFSFCRDACLP